MYKGLTDVNFEQYFQLAIRSTRGHIAKTLKTSCNTELRFHSFAMRIVNRWNRLPSKAVEGYD